MKYILLISTLLFSAGSWAEWIEVSEGVTSGNKQYVDFDRIRKVNGLVYFWDLDDLLEPNSTGTMSYKSYNKADCETVRKMILSMSVYRVPMAEGAADMTYTPDPEWTYAPPESVLEVKLNAVCAN